MRVKCILMFCYTMHTLIFQMFTPYFFFIYLLNTDNNSVYFFFFPSSFCIGMLCSNIRVIYPILCSMGPCLHITLPSLALLLLLRSYKCQSGQQTLVFLPLYDSV